MSGWNRAIERGYISTSPAFGLSASAGRHAFYRLNYASHFPGDLNEPILDIGIGSGDLLLLYERMGYRNVWGVDVNEEPVRLCKPRFPDFHVRRVASTPDFLRAHQSQFSLITMFDVLEHLTRQEMFEVLTAAKGALSATGCLIVQTTNAANLFQIAGRYCDATHEQSFTEVSLRQIFRLAGFERFRVGPVESAAPLTPRRLMKRCLRNIYHSALRLLYRLDDGNRFAVMTALIQVLAYPGKTGAPDA